MLNRNAVFIDTSGWIAALNADDALFKSACSGLLELGAVRRPLITTDSVLAETGNGLARTPARLRFTDALRRFSGSGNCQIIWVDHLLLERSIKLYRQVEDKSWGLVDCASFLVMQDEGLIDAFTSDRHFSQAGFHCLLPTD